MKKLIALATALLLSSIVAAAININTATLEELEALPGVGPVRAQAIIDHRKQNGNFKSKEDLKQVNGIGDKIYADIESKTSLSGATKIDWDTGKKATETDKSAKADSRKAKAEDGKKQKENEAKAAKDAEKEAKAAAKKEKEDKAATAKAEKAEKAKAKADKAADSKKS